MARRRKSNDGGVSLFPFMSILACLIGILTLLISVTMTINQREREGYTQEELDRAKNNDRILKDHSKLVKANEKLQQRINKEKKTVAELEKLKNQRVKLSMKLKELPKTKGKTDAVLQKIVENLKKEAKQLRSEQPKLEKKINELLAELKKRKIKPKENQDVVIQPPRVGRDVPDNLFFVECNSTGIVIRDRGASKTVVSTAAIPTNSKFARFCNKVKRTDDAMILFLIRKTGNDAYLWAAGLAENKFKLKTSKLPVPKDGD
ncbi:MAG: hypothetical protein KJO79_05660, partial [Verrucomicrobiae bacterium]|nr:hypothetical protein [Verrucomicrobiae bacterium]NNJ86648.1 hypothetical protein [Akkermansiaceae bacterium]